VARLGRAAPIQPHVVLAPAVSGVTLVGAVAALVIAAPAGSVGAGVALAGPVAAVTITAPAGSVSVGVTLAGPVVNLAIAAPAGTVDTGGAVTIAGVTATFAVAAPAGTISAAVTLSAPVATFTITALPGSINGELIPDTIDAYLYDPTGQTQIAFLFTADAHTYRDEVSQRGSAGIRIPLDDAGPVDFGGIVKFVWRGQVRFGCRLNSEGIQFGKDGRKWVAFDNQPGLLSLLDQAFIEPEYGLKRTSSSDRHFGYMSADGPWRIASDWHTPRSVPWGQVGGRHFALPVGFTTADNWIARSSPNTGVSASTQNWFICTFTLPATIDVKILAAGDNFLEMFMDGEQILAVDRSNYFAWRTASEIPIRLTAGTHRWAARVENTVPIPAFAGTPNPVGFIANMRKVDKDGAVIAGGPVVQTNTTDWIVTDVQPGFRRAQVAKLLIEEAQARDVPGATSLRIGFTDTHDSDGQPFTDTPDEYSFAIGTISLADVVSQLGESHINFRVDPATMTLNAYDRMGADISASQTLALGEGGGVIAYDVIASSARSTVLLTQLADGTWQETTDAAGLAAVGRIETGVSLGSASTPATAASLAAAQLAESAHVQIGVTCQTSTVQGPQPYRDYNFGDSLTVPGRRGSTMKGRYLAVTVKKVDGAVETYPEFVEDRT
jgi:hypothetical protein